MHERTTEFRLKLETELEDPMLECVTQEEIHEYVAFAHEQKRTSIDGRKMAASILWVLVNEKQRIRNPLLVGYAAKRLAINSHEYHWQEMLVNGVISEVQDKAPKLSRQDGEIIVSAAAYHGSYGDWPDTFLANNCETGVLGSASEALSPYLFGMAVGNLAGSEWAEEIANNLLENKDY